MGTLTLVSRVGGEMLYRGPRPNSVEEWKYLDELGVRTVLNLERGYFEWIHGETNQEVRLANIHNMTPVHLQLGDVFAPSDADLFASVNIIIRALPKGAVYVHCLHGQDRTGMVCAMFRRHYHSWSVEECLKEMFQLGFHKFPYEPLGWVKRLKGCM